MKNRIEGYLGIRLPKALKKLVTRIIEVDTHINVSEFVRSAIREKIQRDAPEQYQELFKAK